MRQTRGTAASAPLEISIRGDEATVARLLIAMAAQFGGEGQAEEPARLLLTREQAARRTGWGLNRFTELVASGVLTNHGSRRKLLIDPSELGELIRRRAEGG